MCHILWQQGSLEKHWNEEVIIRSSHQTDTVIKSEDIKKILWDDFTPILCCLKMHIELFSIAANKFWAQVWSSIQVGLQC